MTEQQATFYGKLFQDMQLTELEIEEDGTRLCFKKKPAVISGLQAPKSEWTGGSTGQQTELFSTDDAVVKQSGSEVTVKAPLLGIFHRASSPSEPAFVEVGDKVEKGDVLCIIEAMKMMNEITAGKDGVIKAICAEENSIVEYGQIIFEMEPKQ